MSTPLLSIITTPQFPDLRPLCQSLGFREIKVDSTRKAVSQLKREAPAVVVAEFAYGYSNNYSGVHISNLDVFLASLPKYAPEAKVVVLAKGDELQYVELLEKWFPLRAVLSLPADVGELKGVLRACRDEGQES